jgi:large subunit ribosomal protein L21
MYAVIATGGKQYRVEEGQQLQVERVGEVGSDVSFAPVLLGDGGSVLSTPEQLGGVTVSGKVVADAKGPKINGFTYKNKTNQRKRWGHRQKLAVIEITSIKKG